MFDSIRTRLTLWYLGVLVLIIIALAALVYLLVARNLSQTTDKNLAEIGRSVEADLRKEEADILAGRLLPVKKEEESSPDELVDAPLTIETAITEELEDLRSRDYGCVVIDQNGQMLGSTITAPLLEEKAKNLTEDVHFDDLFAGSETFRVHQKLLTLDGKPFRFVITRPLREQNEFLANLRMIFLLAFPVTIVLAGLGGYFLARRSLAPVVAMGEQAARIGSSNLSERLHIRNERDELGSLAKIFNDLLFRLEESFRQQKQFMADASHELRTPLAIVRGESEVAISNEKRSAAEYRESLSIVNDESTRLAKIVEDLFVLARADSGQLKPHFANVYLDEILLECVRAVGSLAKKRNIKIECSVLEEMPFAGDETLLHRLFLNLLDNAIKYNREGGTVTVVVPKESGNYGIEIHDTGHGIAIDDQPMIFNRFYRVDKSRTRDNTNGKNGVGLGLSIAAWIAEAHNGSLILKKSDSQGSIFEIQLPR